MTLIKLVMLGGGGVGKSAITIQFVQNKFVNEYDPTIENSYRRQFTVNDEFLMLDVLDTAGQEEYAAMRDSHIREGMGFLVVYSITSKESFKEVQDFRRRFLQVKDKDDFPFILLGNKCDLARERVVSTAEGEALAKEFGCPFKECSAKTRINVDEAFEEVVKIVLKAKATGLYETKGNAFLPPQAKAEKSRCSLL